MSEKEDKDNVIDLSDAGEMAFLITALAATGSITSARRRYKSFYDKTVTSKRVQLIQAKYEDKVRKKREYLLSDEGIRNCPLLQRRVRIEILSEVIESGLELRCVGSFKKEDEDGKEVVVPILKQDLNSVLVALRACRDEDHGFEELELKKKKAAKDEQGDEAEEYDVDDGVA
jgi:hypothetical protein